MLLQKRITQEELKDILIEDYVNNQYYKTYYAVINKDDTIDLFDDKDDNRYKIEILPCYWREEYDQYCRISQEEYNDQLNDEDKINNEELEEWIERDRNNDQAFRDFISLAKDHIDIDSERMEIVF